MKRHYVTITTWVYFIWYHWFSLTWWCIQISCYDWAFTVKSNWMLGWVSGSTVSAFLFCGHSVSFSWLLSILALCLFLIMFCQSVLFLLKFLGWLSVPFVPELSLPMLVLVHLFMFTLSFNFCEISDYFDTHVTVV